MAVRQHHRARLGGTGQRPDYMLIQRHVINIDALFIEYAQHFFAKTEPKAWEVIVQIEAKLNEKNIPRNMIGREARVALEQYLPGAQLRPGAGWPARAVRYDKTYFDKIVASLLPLLEKLTSGKIAQLPGAELLRPGRVRSSIGCRSSGSAPSSMGLDALSDAEVAAAVGNSMFSDLVSVAGHIYKHGIDDGLPGASAGARGADQRPCGRIQRTDGRRIRAADQQGGGAGIPGHRVHADPPDIEARIGNRAKAGQVIRKFQQPVHAAGRRPPRPNC